MKDLPVEATVEKPDAEITTIPVVSADVVESAETAQEEIKEGVGAQVPNEYREDANIESNDLEDLEGIDLGFLESFRSS